MDCTKADPLELANNSVNNSWHVLALHANTRAHHNPFNALLRQFHANHTGAITCKHLGNSVQQHACCVTDQLTSTIVHAGSNTRFQLQTNNSHSSAPCKQASTCFLLMHSQLHLDSRTT
jgi:hypothetical protein